MPCTEPHRPLLCSLCTIYSQVTLSRNHKPHSQTITVFIIDKINPSTQLVRDAEYSQFVAPGIHLLHDQNTCRQRRAVRPAFFYHFPVNVDLRHLAHLLERDSRAQHGGFRFGRDDVRRNAVQDVGRNRAACNAASPGEMNTQHTTKM